MTPLNTPSAPSYRVRFGERIEWSAVTIAIMASALGLVWLVNN